MTSEQQCPIPLTQYPLITLAHGAGGALMSDLIDQMFIATFSDCPDNSSPDNSRKNGHDGYLMSGMGSELILSTDSFVVSPLFFPGGNIGKLAICGTVNDLAMCGAKPQYLSLAFILEEGLAMQTLWKIVQSLKKWADICGVKIVTGDTKVVERGSGDGIFINTTGVGMLCATNLHAHPSKIKSGDCILTNGDIGRHGMAIMSQREGFELEYPIESDCMPLTALVTKLQESGIALHCMRDITRGGLASCLHELSQSASKTMTLIEEDIPVREDVRAIAEIVGIDTMYSACEGRALFFVPESQVADALAIMGEEAKQIGRVDEAFDKVDKKRPSSSVILRTRFGVNRVITKLAGSALPRIC